MVVEDYLQWDQLVVLGLAVVGYLYISRQNRTLKCMESSYQEQSTQLLSLQDDIKVLYESANNLGIRLKKQEQGTKVLKEQQEQLTLKEPNQQAYRNAILAIQNGETVNKISETSGLSLGEVELLKMFQKFNVDSVEEKET